MAFRGFVLMTSFLALRASVCIFLWCLFNYFARFGSDGTATWMEQLPGLDTAEARPPGGRRLVLRSCNIYKPEWVENPSSSGSGRVVWEARFDPYVFILRLFLFYV